MTPEDRVTAFLEAVSVDDHQKALEHWADRTTGERLVRSMERRGPASYRVGAVQTRGERSTVELKREQRTVHVLVRDDALVGLHEGLALADRWLAGEVPDRIEIDALPAAEQGAVEAASTLMAELVSAEGMVQAPANLRLMVVSAQEVDPTPVTSHQLAELSMIRFDAIGPHGIPQPIWLVYAPAEQGFFLVQAVTALVPSDLFLAYETQRA